MPILLCPRRLLITDISIYFDKKIINITKSYSWATHKIGPTKTKSSVRKIAVNDFLLDKLKELKQNNYHISRRDINIKISHGGLY